MKFCSTCKHSDDKLAGKLICTRFPPSVSVVMMPQGSRLSGPQGFAPTPISAFPTVNDGFFCGEWAAAISFAS